MFEFVFFLSALMPFLWHFVFLFVWPLQKIPEGRKQTQILRHHAWVSSIVRGKDDKCGWIVGKWFIGYLSVSGEGGGGGGGGGGNGGGEKTRDLYLFGTFPENDKEDDNNDVCRKIQYVYREGPFWDLRYSPRTLPDTMISTLHPFPKQEQAVKRILDEFTTSKLHRCVCAIYGSPGTGKSKLAFLLAKEILFFSDAVTINRYWKPWDCNDFLQTMYQQINPSEKHPLIVVLEEFDVALLRIGKGDRHAQSKNMQTPVSSKDDWNLMLDEIDDGLFPHMILLLTTNKMPDEITDPSFIRPGRVHLSLTF